MTDSVTQQPLNEKIQEVFANLAIDKRRLPASGLKERGIPAYVAEWVLDSVVKGHGVLTNEEASKVQAWSKRYIPLPNDKNVIHFNISQGETVKILTPVQAMVNLKRKAPKSPHYAVLPLLGIDDAAISNELLETHQDLLKQGMWGVAELGQLSDGPAVLSFRPMQAKVNLDLYRKARSAFSLAEWRALLLTTMGYNVEALSESQQVYLLCRLLPLVQKNMHLMELAPKGTGKSYIFENISPRVRLVSGGNVSPAVLFVNNASGQWGLLARFAVVVLDEVQTLRFEKPEEIIGGLKGYLANGQITRGGLHESASDCGLVMLANIRLDEQQRPMREILVEELPEFLQETAFLDRIKGLIPGWKLPKLSSDLLINANSKNAVGLKSDFFGDVLLKLRDTFDTDQFVAENVILAGERPYRRNEDSVRAIASGLLKIQFPDGNVTPEVFRETCLKPAIELRQGIWEQLYKLDGEYRQYERRILPS